MAESVDITPAEMELLQSKPVGRYGMRLLEQQLQISGGVKTALFDIVTIELFDGLLADEHLRDFRENPRTEHQRVQGETFLTWHRGAPALNVVSNGPQKNVVCIRGLRTADARQKAVTLPQVFQRAGALSRKKFESFPPYRTHINAQFDGLDTRNSQSVLQIKEAVEPVTVLNIRRVVSKNAANSLGIFKRID